ncbi:MAG: M20/M25/M40 family metallo-hydrolase, partial [Gemmatimonadetes bacterium]|nr:M20/M25/M40 family metallo-hydrolase [Gemmatimonadota bacterium]
PRLTVVSPILLALVVPAPARSQSQPSHPAAQVSERAIAAHLGYLADDALEGRAPGTRGERLSALYIAAQFRRLGLEPAGDTGTYFQHFAILGYRPSPPSAGSVDTAALAFGADFVARPSGGDTLLDLSAEAVFVGYGISAPAYRRDDYGATDVRGRIVVSLSGSPLAIDSSRTLGTYYGEDNYKRDEARRRGAAALLLLTHPARAAAWDSVSRRYHEPAWINAGGGDGLRLVGLLNPERANALARRNGATVAELARSADGGSLRPRSLGRIRLQTRGSIRARIQAMNVVGCLPGQAAGTGEVVLAGGHYDHLGIGPAVDGDSIYNGALDNASGTATLLAAAEALATSGVRPNRSVCFIAFGAEERGMLGSQAYVAAERNPGRIVAMLNIDGANLWGRTRDIAVLGDDQTTLGARFRSAVAAEGLSVTVHPIEVRQRFFFRSDHISFARAGIPSLFLRRGNQLVEGGVPLWEQRWQDYYGTRYHKPSDHVLSWHSPAGAAQQARVMVRVLLDVANDPERPAWEQASEFRALIP